jgi:excisionase family DNA binding protein
VAIKDELMTVPKAAERLDCSRYHVYDLVNAGLLPRRLGGTKGNRLRIAESDLQAYIDSTRAPLPKRTTAA